MTSYSASCHQCLRLPRYEPVWWKTVGIGAGPHQDLVRDEQRKGMGTAWEIVVLERGTQFEYERSNGRVWEQEAAGGSMVGQGREMMMGEGARRWE